MICFRAPLPRPPIECIASFRNGPRSKKPSAWNRFVRQLGDITKKKSLTTQNQNARSAVGLSQSANAALTVAALPVNASGILKTPLRYLMHPT